MEESWGKRIWRLAYPALTYYGINVAVVFLAMLVISMGVLMDYNIFRMTSEMLDSYVAESVDIALAHMNEIQCVFAVVSIPVLYLYYRMDIKRSKLKRTVKKYEKVPVWQYIFAAILGIAACFAGNCLISLGGQLQEGAGASEVYYAGKLGLEIVTLGILSPAAEELLFRGLIYKRAKEYFSLPLAVVFSSVVFGLYHGNLIQALYGFLMGLLAAYVYERYHSLFAPVLFHGAGNILAVLAMETRMLSGVYSSKAVFMTVTVLFCLLILVAMAGIEKMVFSAEVVSKGYEASNEQPDK